MYSFNIAILDDEKNILDTLSTIITKEGHNVFTYLDSKTFFKDLGVTRIDILFLDINLGINVESGIDVLKRLKKEYPDISVVIISGNADIKTAVEAIKIGADEFLEKPLHLKPFLETIKSVTGKALIKYERNQLLDDVLDNYNILGISQQIKDVKSKIIKYAQLNEPILVTGESGTGKELVAANLHYHSNRRSNKYLKVNIASLSESLIESQLFGYKKGAFTGASNDSAGLFVSANNSTLFLDEIGELKMDLQVKLLRAIHEKEIMPVGSVDVIHVNTRLIFATNKNLLEQIKENKFREDLYYRISALQINIPPLREHKDDIPILVDKFIKDFSMKNNVPIKTPTDAALDKLCTYHYPGNIRELKNIITQAVIHSESDDRITDADIMFRVEDFKSKNSYFKIFDETTLLNSKKNELEKIYIMHQIKKHNNDLKETANDLGILVNNLYRKINKLEIDTGN